MLRKLFSRRLRPSGKGSSSPVSRRILALEPLEDRTLLAVLTLTSLSASPSSVVFGQAVTLTATVTSNPPGGQTPTGQVDFIDETPRPVVDLGKVNLVAGVASLSTAALTVETHTIIAKYLGDANFQASTTMAGPTSIITTAAGNATAG